MSDAAIDAYRQAQKLGVRPRQALATAFAKAASRLSATARDPGDYTAYAEALNSNRMLWTVVQADVADAANRLPDDIKTDLLSLSLFVDRRTVEALARPNAGRLAALIEIDRNLARGLGA